MKKLVALFTLVCVMLSAVACGAAFPENAKDAKKILEREDCLVEITDDISDLESLLGDLGSDVEDVLEEVLIAYNDDSEMVIMFFCTSSLKATAFKAGFDQGMKSSLSSLEDYIDVDDYKSQKSGKVVVWGHEDLIETLLEG